MYSVSPHVISTVRRLNKQYWTMRRQLTLFLPLAHRVVVDPIRQRLDPLQHAIVPAHVTLCRDEELTPWQGLSQNLANLGPFAITLQFGEPQVLSDGCVLLRPSHGAEEYQHLRRSILGPLAKHHGAHITLLHPRNVAGVTYNLAEINHALIGLTITFRTISLIEQHGAGPWVVRQDYGAAF
ncbi:hypothetical protein BH20ACI2_BH20ACI2_12020 [soil metagenome]